MMTAIARVGGEWKIGYAAQEARAIHGAFSSAQIVIGAEAIPGRCSIVEPGRTGGAMFRHQGGMVSTPLGPRWVAASTTCYADEAVRETRRPLGDPDEYEVPEGEFLIGRAYVKINQLPASTVGGGLLIFRLGGADRSAGDPTDYATGVWLYNDGHFGIPVPPDRRTAPSFASLLPADDQELVMPVGQWVMLEAAASWSTTEARTAFVRVTLPGQEPRIIYRRCDIPPSPYRIGAQVAAGILSAGSSDTLLVDADDIGLNTSEGEANNTWLGPGIVRVARPIADAFNDPAYDVGTPASTMHAQNRTMVNHPRGPGPLNILDIVESRPFYEALNNNPMLGPTNVPMGPTGRWNNIDRMVTSVGTDFHEHGVGQPDSYIDPERWYFEYDMPRLAFGGERLGLVCDASVREGALSFARAVALCGRTGWFGGASDTIQFSSRSDAYVSLYTDNEEEPALGGPPGGGFPEDLAQTNFGQWVQTVPTIAAAWRPVLGRFQQHPGLPETPILTFRREHLQHVLGGDHGALGTPEEFEQLQEWLCIGAGIIYESGYEPQDPLPTCDPGFIEIGPGIAGTRRRENPVVGNHPSAQGQIG
jgi:hypothetical protein